MNIVCVICSDLLIPADDVFYTPCGHIFHFVCLTQWLERSKSCPQCREKTTEARIHRIYFNFSNNDTITEDASCLQDRIDKLKFQILVKDNEIKKFTEKIALLEKQNVGLRKEVKTVETELIEKKTAIAALKDQTKYFKQQCLEVEGVKQENTRLQKKVEEYKNVQILLDAPCEDVDEMISRTADPNTLITYISVMKREMVTSLNKRRELRTKLRSLQQDLTKVSMERNFLSEEHGKRKRLEEELLNCESEKLTLYNEITKLKAQIAEHKCHGSSSSKLEIHQKDLEETPSSAKQKSQNEETIEKQLSEKVEKPVLPKPTDKENGENSPYLPVKSQAVFALSSQFAKRRPTMNLGSSILSKRPRIDQIGSSRPTSTSTITYNGLGGHSKFEQFPNPISNEKFGKTKSDSNLPKKSKLDAGRNQKLYHFTIATPKSNANSR